MQHANPPLTPKSFTRSTCWEWGRWRQAGEERRRDLSCLRDRSSRPKSSPAQVPDEEAQKIRERREMTGALPRKPPAHGRQEAGALRRAFEWFEEREIGRSPAC